MKRLLFTLLIFIPIICWGQCTCGQFEKKFIKPINHTVNLKVIKSIEEITYTPKISFLGPTLINPLYYREEITHEATVLDAGFDSFVATQKGIDFYSNDYLKTKNKFLVNEWNSRCNQPSVYDRKIYEATIDYDSKTNYGKEVEYKLYMFFKFMEANNNISFQSLAKL